MIRNPCHRRRGMQRAAAAGLCALLAGFLTKGSASGEPPLPVAEFAELTTTATERDGKIALKVEFSHAFSGRLAYSVDGTAEPGTDFDYAEAGIDAEDPVRETEIVIGLRDDALVEDMETIRVTLQSGDGFLLGSRQQHTVNIRDNDANWRVVHDVDGMRFDYRMQIVDSGGNTAATVTSDGGNGLPAGTYPVKLTAEDDRFEATIGPITVAADQTLLGADIARTFTLLADPSSVRGHSIDYERLLIGSAVEAWTAAESASHLTRRKPILGTFLMSRTTAAVPFENAGEDREGKESSGSKTATSLTDQGPESGCGAVDMSGTRHFSVTPRKSTPQDQQTAWIGQPFAPHVPYPNFVAETLDRARADLYYDKASTQEEKNAAAFRYKTLLYEKEKVGAETYIRAQFDKIEDLWDCAARKRANQTAQNVIGALRYAPWNRELRWALLDIYYDIAVAEKALAQEKHVAVAEIMIKEPAQGELLIHEEIAKLEEALPLYRKALAGYMKVMQYTFGVDVADFETTELLDEPFGYYIFRKEVALRSPLVALFRNDDGDWIFSQDADFGDERPMLFQGYKDVTLLFELLREYLRTAEQLSKGYVMRGGPSDFERAERLIDDALLATWLEGNALLAMFPEIDEEGGPIDPESGLREAVAGWRHSYSALGHMRSMLNGDTNILGFADDFLVLPQSVVPGDPNREHFHSYDFFRKYLPADGGPLGRAKKDLMNARVDYDNYRDRNDQLAQQFHDRAEHYDSRLREIVGVRPGEPEYEDSTGNKGGAISQQLMNIEQARQRIDMNRQRIEKLQGKIRIEIGRRGREKGINDAISTVYVTYGRKQEELTQRIAEINGEQARWNNIVSAITGTAAAIGSAAVVIGGTVAAPVTGGTSIAVGASIAAPLLAYGINALSQESKEEAKGRLQASKERHAALERMEVQSLQDDLLDVNSKARIETLSLQMSMLALESSSATIGLRRV